MAPRPLQAVVEAGARPDLVVDAGRRIVAPNDRPALLFGHPSDTREDNPSRRSSRDVDQAPGEEGR
jgi:hypothetical protein